MFGLGRGFSRFVLSLLAFSFIIGFSVAMPTSARAQIADPAPSAPCGIFDLGCYMDKFMGDPAQLQANIDEARVQVKALGCWSCKVFNAFGSSVFTSGQSVSAQGDASLRPVLVAVGTLFALVYLGSAFASGDAGDLIGRWKVFWKLCMAIALGSAWMSGGSFNNTWSFVYGPLLSIPLAVEQAVPGGNGSQEGCDATVPSNAPPGSQQAMSRMVLIVCGANNIALDGISFGIGLSNTGDGFIGSIINMITGIILAIIFGWITITFPLRFIDVLLRLAVVGIITPVLVVCAVFKPLRSVVQIGISNVLYAGCLFAFTGIMFKVGNGFLISMLQDASQDLGTMDPAKMLARGIVLIGTGVIFASMIKMAPSLAAEFSSFRGQSGGVGDAAAGFASGIVTMPIKGAGAVGQSVVSGAIAGKSMAGGLGKGVTK